MKNNIVLLRIQESEKKTMFENFFFKINITVKHRLYSQRLKYNEGHIYNKKLLLF